MMGVCNEAWRQVHFSLHPDVTMAHIITIAVMLMETFERLSRKDKYVWDVSVLITSVRFVLIICLFRCALM